MKIKKGEDIYICPFNNKINVLVENECKEEIISCLNEYFEKGKKNYCQIFDDYDQKIPQKEFSFVYVPYLSSISGSLEFKEKSIANTYISKIIEDNQELFTSVENIRECIFELLTDNGMYRLRKILGQGLDGVVEFSVGDFDTSKLLSFIRVNYEELTETEKYMLLYNLLIFVNRNVNTIVYLDFPIDEKVIKWINKATKDNVIFLMNNNIISNAFNDIETCTLLSVSNKNYMESMDFDISEFNEISYVFKPIVKEYIQFQNKKIIDIFHQFDDLETTFCLNFRNLNIQNSFI